ncbi:hypothetical protein OH492_11200 [Vibrio chagasii]|nr:hypothetical protein [Vibrio chagasii]
MIIWFSNGERRPVGANLLSFNRHQDLDAGRRPLLLHEPRGHAINGEYIDRLSAVKHVLSDFIERRKGDRSWFGAF